mmetsp:Transcript_9377/g.15117  ORF Transcript_9377/g.15117 Transcript_9377/m.15117 type:complete len:747 (-) Transcript_9377:81-2321(-)
MTSGYPKHGGGSPMNSSKAQPSKQHGSKRNKELRADFLLNFQRPSPHQRPQGSDAPVRRSRPSGRHYHKAPTAYVRGRFVQSSFRLFVDGATMDVFEASLSADALIDWPHVRCVDLFCDEHPKCPICLEESLVVPKITRCGHIFCMPCIMRYFIMLQGTNLQAVQRCPVCNERVSPEDLTSVRFQMTRPLQEDSKLSFFLVHREASSISVRASAAAAMDVAPPTDEGEDSDDIVVEAFHQLPTESDNGWHFSRVVRLQAGEFLSLLRQEVEGLRLYRPEAIRAGDTELLPSIDAAVTLLDQKLGAGKLQVPDSEPTQPQPPWGCRYVDLTFGNSSGSSDAPVTNATDVGADLEYDDDAIGDDGPPPEKSSPLSGCSPSPLLASGNCPSSPSRATAADDELASLQPLPAPRTCIGKGGARIISFYQATDGRLVFLQPFYTKLLLHEHGGRWDRLPASLSELRLERMHELAMTEEVRKRYRFLAHLPLGSPVWLAEVDLRGHLSKETKEVFAEEFAKRRQQRLKEKAKSRREERHSKQMAAEQEEQYYRSLNRARPSTVPALLPTKEDFAVDLLGREVVEEAVDNSLDGISGEGETDRVEEDSSGPTLADKIKARSLGKIAAKAKKQEVAHNFPSLGASSAGSGRGNSTVGSAWGAGRGSEKVRNSRTTGAISSTSQAEGDNSTMEVPDAWDDEEEPTFGAALEAALQSASIRTTAVAEVEPEASDTTAGARKKKGRAAKATTIRLFG